jgi:hypothetical protein
MNTRKIVLAFCTTLAMIGGVIQYANSMPSSDSSLSEILLTPGEMESVFAGSGGGGGGGGTPPPVDSSPTVTYTQAYTWYLTNSAATTNTRTASGWICAGVKYESKLIPVGANASACYSSSWTVVETGYNCTWARDLIYYKKVGSGVPYEYRRDTAVDTAGPRFTSATCAAKPS